MSLTSMQSFSIIFNQSKRNYRKKNCKKTNVFTKPQSGYFLSKQIYTRCKRYFFMGGIFFFFFSTRLSTRQIDAESKEVCDNLISRYDTVTSFCRAS